VTEEEVRLAPDAPAATGTAAGAAPGAAPE
jgi:hypothetical protein